VEAFDASSNGRAIIVEKKIEALSSKREAQMTKEKIVEKIKDILKTDLDLNFLMALKEKDLETLIACIRDRVDQVSEK